MSTTLPESATVVEFDRTAWTTAVRRVSEMAHAKLPEALHGRVERGTALVLHGAVHFEEDGHTCQVRASDGRWMQVNGTCQCEDAQYSSEHFCKHRLARGIYLRASEMMQDAGRHIQTMLTVEAVAEEPAADLPTKVPVQYVVMIQGKRYIRYAGLLYLAHQRGLVSLKARFISVTPELALAEAEATFADGKVFVEAADSTPTNCGAQVRQHYPRMALVRCKARALRDALNLGDLCTVEELSEGD